MPKYEVKPGFKEFSINLKENKLSKVLFLYGIEEYLVKWAVDTLVKKYINSGSKAMDFIVLDEDNCSVDDIISANETFSMFSEKRIVWVRNFKPILKESSREFSDTDIERLKEYLDISNDNSILIFSVGDLDEGKKNQKSGDTFKSKLLSYAQSYCFNQLDKRELISFAGKRFKSRDIQITPQIMRHLIDATGYFNKESDYRLYNFENDLEKVIAHSNGKVITNEDIDGIISSDLSTFIFDMFEGISKNQKEKAFSILHNMLQDGKSAMTINATLVSQFELMLEMKEFSEDGFNLSQIQGKLKVNEYRLKKLMPFINNYSLDKLRKILSKAYDVDRNIKKGLLSPQMSLELLIAYI